MLKLHAFLNRKPSSLLPPPCQVEAVVELDAVSFENLLQRPMDDQPQITAHKSLMRCEEGVEHCVLFLGEGSQDGVLVNSEGYDWARYAAFIPGARMIANSHLEQGISLAELIGFRNHTKEVHGRFCFIDPPTEILPPSAECIRAVQQISHRKAAILGIYPSQAAVCKGVLDHQR